MSGFKNDVVVAKNGDFSQAGAPNATSSESNGLITNGQLWIGSTATNAGGTHINVGTLTSPDGSVTIGYSSPNITLTASSSGTFTPNATVNIFDDFIGAALQVPASGSSIIDSQLSWNFTAGTLSNTTNGTSSHPGILSWTNTASDINFRLNQGTDGLPLVLGGGELSLSWVVNIGNLSTGVNTYILYIGLSVGGTSEPTDGVYFVYSNGLNSGNWSGKTASASSRTTVNSGTAVTTGWHNLTLTVNAAATLVEFFVDGVSIGTANANIPSAAITPAFLMDYSAGTISAGTVQVDLFYLSQTLTTPR